MATLSGTLYAAFGLMATGNLGKPNASNGLQGRFQADGFALSDNKNADFSGTGTTVTFNSDAVAWAAVNKTGSDLADLATKSHTDLTDKGSNTHTQIDTHLGLTNEHIDWSGASAGTIHTDNYIEGGPGTDGTALHDNVANEITAIATKATPVAADELVIEDSAASFVKKAVTFSAFEGALDHDNLSGVTANEHLDWTASVGTIHTGNYIEGGAGTDTTAIHDNETAEISAIAEKTVIVGADLMIIEDSEASNAKKRVQISNLPGGTDADAIHDNVANEITAITAKATPVASDEFLIEDSGASFVKKAVTFANLEGTLSHDSLADYAVGQHRTINDAGSGATDLWSAQKIGNEIADGINGVDWQESVLDIVDNTAVPPTEVTGDRYILDNTGASHGDWDGAAAWDLVEFNGSTWDVVYDASANEGGATWVEDVNSQYVHNGTSWVVLAGVTAHNSLSGLQGGQASQYYHLTSSEHTEIAAILAATDITGAQLEILSDGSDAGSLHIHDSDYFTETEIGSVTGGSEGMTLIGAGGFSNLVGATIGAVLDDIDAAWDDANWDSAYSHSTGDGSDHADVATNTTHSSGDGSDHADVATNTTHSSGDGTDHSAISSGHPHQSVVSGASPAFTSAALTTPVITTKLTFDETTNDLDVTATDQTSGVGTANFPDLAGATIDVVMRTLAQTLTNKTVALGSNTVSGSKAEHDTAVTDGAHGWLDGNNTWTGEQTFDTVVLGGDGASPEAFCLEIPFTVLNPGNTVNAGDLVVLDSTGDVQPRSSATQIPIGTARNTATQGNTCYVCIAGIVPYNTADSPSINDELFVRNETTFDTMTTTAPSAGKSMMPCLHIGSGQMLIGWSKLWEFET